MNLDLALKRIVVQNLPSTLKNIYENVLLFLNEFYLTKTGKDEDVFDEVIDFFTMPYADIIKKVVTSFTDGLESLGVSPVVTSKEFYIHFKEIVQDPELKTRRDWIDKRLTPYIQEILLEELFKFLAGASDSIIPRLIELDLIPEQSLDDLVEFKEKYPKIQLLYRRFVVTDELLKRLPGIDEILKFTRAEENLQSLYFVYKIFQFFGWTKKLDVAPLSDFLKSRQADWSNFGYNLDLSNPSPLLCGLYLADVLDVPIDTSIPLAAQKEKLADLVENYDEPLIENPFVVDTVLKILKVLNLELSPKFREALKKNKGFEMEKLHDRDLSTLYKFVSLLDRFGLLQESVGPKKLEEMVELLKKFQCGNAFSYFADEDECSPLASYSAFKVAQRLDALALIDVKGLLSFFLETYEDAIKFADFFIPQTLADIWYCLKFFQTLEQLPGKVFLNLIFEFSELPNLEFTPEIEELIPEKPPLERDQSDLVEGIAEALKKLSVEPATGVTPGAGTPVNSLGSVEPEGVEGDALGGSRVETTNPPSKPEIVWVPEKPEPVVIPAITKVSEPDQDTPETETSTQGAREAVQSRLATSPVEPAPEKEPLKPIVVPGIKRREETPVTPLEGGEGAADSVGRYDVKRFLKNLKQPQRLDTKRLKKLHLNLKNAFTPNPFTWSTPKAMMLYLFNLRMMGLPLTVDEAQIVEMMSPFVKTLGPEYSEATAFGDETARVPDPENTFYGVAIYKELGFINQIDRISLKRYLIDVLRGLHPLQLKNALFTAMALHLLTADGMPVVANPEYISPFLRVGPDHMNPAAPFDDLFCIVTFLRIVGADRNISVFNEFVKREAENRVDFNGSIDRLATTSAKVFLVLFQLGLLEDEKVRILAENLTSYLERHVDFFSDNLVENAKGASWQDIDIVYETELEMLFFTLASLVTLYPAPEGQPPIPICKNCGEIFDERPKFCNKCGTPF
ncbi:MAG: hypothetical protein ACTSU5_12400 [Promethearchaeota archaeon]